MSFLNRARLIPAAVVALALASACGSSKPSAAPKAPPHAPVAAAPKKTAKTAKPAKPMPPMKPAAGAPGARLSANQIWKVAEIINRDEVTQARVAAPRAQNPTVKSYAKHSSMSAERDDRAERVAEARSHAYPQNSRITDRLAADERNELQRLLKTPGSQVDRAYIDIEVRRQENALDLIDQLLPQSRDWRLTNQLLRLRTHVATHLAVAKRIQSDLAPPPATPPNTPPTEKK
jgi:predicted outer membrane protein